MQFNPEEKTLGHRVRIQGIATLQMLNVLEGFDLRAMGFNSPQALHTGTVAEIRPNR